MLAKKSSLQKQDISEKIQYGFEVALVTISKGQIVISSCNCFSFSRLDMVEIKGKRDRKVPLHLTKEVKEAIDVLVEKRIEVGINQENPYLFAATGNGSLGHLSP